MSAVLEESLDRVLVDKALRVTPEGIRYESLPPDIDDGSGFELIADYASQALYEGPQSTSAQFQENVRRRGFEIDSATDLDFVSFHDYIVDPTTGGVSPVATWVRPLALEDADRLFLVVLKGPPTPEWLDDLTSRGLRLIEALPPVAYLARAEPKTAADLPTVTRYVRAVVAVSDGMKVLAFPPSPTESALRPVSIQTFEESDNDSILAFLESIAGDAVVRVRLDGNRYLYDATIGDDDVSVVSSFGSVYSVSASGLQLPSSERQGVLVLAPLFSGSRMTLPVLNPNYAALLIGKGITNFNNTKIGMLDTGFDDATNTHPDVQGAGAQVTVLKEPIFMTARDRYTHGTISASVAVGYAPITSLRKDSQGYRFSLGLAETCRLVTNKICECSGSGAVLSTALNTMVAQNVNVINLSINDLSMCSYTANSLLIDSRTRSEGWLFTVSAGNDYTPTGSNCHTVQGPATAKNAIAVGATNNYTPQGWSNCPEGDCDDRSDICPFNYTQLFADQNARNISRFSAYRDKDSMVKPDLVAPGVRITAPVSRTPVMNWCSPPYGVLCNENIVTQEGVQYGFSAGTSFAAPAVAGAVAVIRTWYTASLNMGNNPSPALTKAILINGARDLGGEPGISAAQVLNADFTSYEAVQRILATPGPPGYTDHQGWGMLNLTRLLDSPSNHFYADQGIGLSNNNSWSTPTSLVSGSAITRITVVWTDVPSSVSAHYSVVNNLDLVVCDNLAVKCFYANRFNSSGMSIATPPNPTFSDLKNNVEEVLIPAGTYASGTSLFINVLARNVMSGPQDFAVFTSNTH